jgi:cell division septum initiation protein DivIVA
MALAHKLAMQVRDTEDRIYQLETEVKQYQARAANAEKWLQLIEKEIEEKLIAPASRSENRRSNSPMAPARCGIQHDRRGSVKRLQESIAASSAGSKANCAPRSC